MDQDEIRQQFEATGVVRLDAAFSADDAAAMRSAVWGYAKRKSGLDIDDRSSWPQGQPAISWKGLKGRGAWRAVFENEAVTSALGAVFGVGGWSQPKPAAQILMTFPQPGPWVFPDGWHMDCGFDRPTWPVFAVKLFAFFGEVGPEGGGTMLLPGIHRVVARYREGLSPKTGGNSTSWQRFMKHDPWLGELIEGASLPDGGRSLVGQSHDVDGIPVEVVELTGKPGDVILTHLHVFHSASPNTADVPRQMLGKEIVAASERPARPAAVDHEDSPVS